MKIQVEDGTPSFPHRWSIIIIMSVCIYVRLSIYKYQMKNIMYIVHAGTLHQIYICIQSTMKYHFFLSFFFWSSNNRKFHCYQCYYLLIKQNISYIYSGTSCIYMTCNCFPTLVISNTCLSSHTLFTFITYIIYSRSLDCTFLYTILSIDVAVVHCNISVILCSSMMSIDI